MAIPSGSGTEVLRRGVIATQTTTATSFKFDGTNPSTGTSSYTVPANHIITMISIIICEAAGNPETFDLYMNDGASQIHFTSTTPLAASATFVWNDKFVLIGGDKLAIAMTAGAGGGDMDVYYTYLDQDWS